MEWFRFYSETLDDLKLARAATEAGVERVVIVGAWTGLLSLANSSPERGKLLLSENMPLTVAEMAHKIGTTPKLLETIIRHFVKLGMVHWIEIGPLCISNWDDKRWGGGSQRGFIRHWEKKRNEVLRRDLYICQYCGAPAEHVDHVFPLSRGGTHELDNLVASCAHCNLVKNARTPEEAGMILRKRDGV